MSQNPALNSEFIKSAVLYRLLEKNDPIPIEVSGTKYEFLERELDGLVRAGLIEANLEEQIFEPTQSGAEAFDRLLDVYEALLDLDVFATVNLSLELEDDLFDEEGQILDEELDPRFEEASDDEEAERLGSTDLRLPLLDFMAERACQKQKQNYNKAARHAALSRVVFLQELGNEKFSDDDAFFDLKHGTFAGEIDDIVSSVPPWIELAREFSPPEKLMNMIAEAGFSDAIKREMIDEEEKPVWLEASEREKTIAVLLSPLV